ncbi:hypothetical protein HMPREF1981_01662 [Bacteroides pyogenes F0041]|uniref:DUF4923 domain-containing protein n=1 Tax=Bacteroides pyogenes F0041 TaxID=1321819 RepID=U2CN42_9BACE|nr:DUF4923 family protein [Bacteroides pyogenes]ERI85488.1 hypothetical protein HMPREF1981_01662 [Bacteroides pyogenes F0041]MBB3894670.1 hypothetical protein [Bacteroides pyogenes]GAE21013.1 hypothetical protein JCM10003_409 [Bacteroides pyogenes JCM 10003]SUV34984.1 Uncharacterised protein [Bacteroides pyogenes]
MKKNTACLAFIAFFSLLSANCHAQSWKDLLGKDNISKVVEAVTGQTSTKVDLTGTWSYESSAVEFKSENLLMKAGGMAAATMAESKLNEQLGKVGIRAGQMSFTFNADSTFVSKVGGHTMKGTYSYDSSTKRVQLKFLKLLNMYAKVNYRPGSMELLFNSDKLLKLMTFIGSNTNNTAIRSGSSLAKNYDGMMLGFGMKK